MSIQVLRSQHADLARLNAQLVGARDNVRQMIAANDGRTKDLNDKQKRVSECIILVQRFSEGIQTGVVHRFEDLLTRGVRQIFGKEYKVTIEFATSGNTLNADFFMTLPDGKKVSLANGEGGGMRDLVSVLQRILYVVLEPTRPARILFLDENLKALDVGRAPAAFTFIKELCRELDIQVVFVTHQQAATEIDSDGMRVVALGG